MIKRITNKGELNMIKTNERVENMQDVQNIITAIIFRQVESFSKTDLIEAVLHYTKGSKAELNEDAIKDMINSTLDTAISNDWLRYRLGQFRPSRTVTRYRYEW